MFDISKTWIGINCPKCNYYFEIQLQDVELESTVYCHNCKQSILLVDNNASTAQGIQTIENAFSELEKTFKNLLK